MNKHIIITTTSFGQYDRKPLEVLEQNGYQYRINPFKRQLTGKEFVELAKDAIGAITGTEKLDANVLRQASNLRVISRCGVGLDNIDLKEAKNLKIRIFNTPDAPTQAVAELAVGLILSLLRDLFLMNHQLHQGIWQKKMGALLRGKKLGVLGFGSIGQEVARLAHALGAEIIYCDPYVSAEKFSNFRSLALTPFLHEADIVTVHVSLNEKTKNLIGKKQFNEMKDGAYFINCSRGGIVDEQALYDALKMKKLAGAAMDVFLREPYQGLLQELDNIILTPHIGSYAREARIKMEMDAVYNLLKGFKE